MDHSGLPINMVEGVTSAEMPVIQRYAGRQDQIEGIVMEAVREQLGARTPTGLWSLTQFYSVGVLHSRTKRNKVYFQFLTISLYFHLIVIVWCGVSLL